MEKSRAAVCGAAGALGRALVGEAQFAPPLGQDAKAGFFVVDFIDGIVDRTAKAVSGFERTPALGRQEKEGEREMHERLGVHQARKFRERLLPARPRTGTPVEVIHLDAAMVNVVTGALMTFSATSELSAMI